jgi:hypothetical protein
MRDDDSKYSVWTTSTDAEWAEHNAGDPSMVLIGPVPLYQAKFLRTRLLRLHPQDTYEVRDEHNKPIPGQDMTQEDMPRHRPTRRPLSKPSDSVFPE